MSKWEGKKDEDIVSFICSKDQEDYSFIVERYESKLFRYAYSILKDKDKALDIVQDTFIKAFINLKSFNTKKSFSSWIYRIAHNEAINYIKKNRFNVRMDEDFDIESDENLSLDFEKKEIKSKMERCLIDMPLIYGEPLSLYFIEEKSYEEISDILRIPMGTVATRINRAKLIFKKICQKHQIR